MQALENGMMLLDAFPFDSSPNLVYTNQGYPRGDRAVDAWTMRSTFRQFFSTGVFGTPANAFEISKGTGLSVIIQPGMCVIEGGMGGISEKSGPLTLTLGTGPAQGKTPYGIMLRYDDNSDVRGITVYAKKGTPGDSPVPPEPDTTSANVHELRLGYVIVPNGATDLSAATVTNEKGASVCPYAAPFVELDLDAIVRDAQSEADEVVARLNENANTSLENVQKFIADNMELIESALDGTTAGHLQNQIDELKESTLNEDSLNARYFEFVSDTPDAPEKLSMKESSIGERELQAASVGSDELQDGSVTMEKFDASAIDTSGGLASSDALFRTTNDVFELAYRLHLSSLDSLDVDTVFKWDFNADATLNSGQWNGTYYYADKGAGN